jgi:4'-phosphopantetheinyl transferase
VTAVDIWVLRLTRDAQAERDARELLTADEQRSVDRFRVEDDRAARLRTRALLRTVLATAQGCAPRVVELTETADGKPALVGGVGPRFSVSHSRTLAVVATCAARDVGIDVELRRELDWREVATRFFAPAELAAVEQAPAPLDAFFATWVRKEAYLKGLGLGFQSVSDGFEVPLTDGTVRDPARTTTWYLHGLDLDADHAAALAVEGGPATVVVRDASRVGEV